MKKSLAILWLASLLTGCSSRLKSAYADLSSPEKTWVILHPFKAKKGYPLAAKALKVADSLARLGMIDKDNNGGTYDAFKHSFWMASTAQRIGKKSAIGLGKAHEKGNYKAFLNRQQEDGLLPDLPSSQMDAFNNEIGAEIGWQLRTASSSKLVERVLLALNNGELKMLLKDKEGYFLDCNKKRIPSDSLKNRWETTKCLIATKPFFNP